MEDKTLSDWLYLTSQILFISVLLSIDNNVWANNRISFGYDYAADLIGNVTVSDFTVSDDGRLWIATRSGLYSYDGTDVARYTVDNSDIAQNWVWKIDNIPSVGISLALWGNGVQILDLNTEEFVSIEFEGLTDTEQAKALNTWNVIYNGDQLYIANEAGLFSIDTVENYSTRAERLFTVKDDEDAVTDFIEVDTTVGRKRILATYGNGIVELLDDSYIYLTKGLDEFNGYVWSIDSLDDNVIVGSESGLYEYSFLTGEASFESALMDLTSSLITDVYIDQGQSIWASTWGNGLFSYSTNSGLTHEYVADHLKSDAIQSNTVWTVLEDLTGSIWVGSEKGLHRQSDPAMSISNYSSLYLNSKLINANYIETVYPIGDSTFLLGTESAGLLYINEDLKVLDSINSQVFPSFNNNNVTDIERSEDGHYWVATRSGVYKVGINELGKLEVIDALLQDKNVADIHKTKDAVLWIGIYGEGVSRFDEHTKTLTSYNSESMDITGSTFESIWVTAVHGEDGLTVWVGADGGLSLLRLESTRQPNRLSSVEYYSLGNVTAVTSNTTSVYVSNGEGIFVRSGNGEFEQIYSNSSFRSRRIQDLFTSDKRLWVSTRESVFGISTTERTIEKHIDVRELNLTEIQQRSLRMLGNTLLVSGSPGFSEITLFEASDDRTASEYGISELKVNGQTIESFNRFKINEPRRDNSQEIVVPYGGILEIVLYSPELKSLSYEAFIAVLKDVNNSVYREQKTLGSQIEFSNLEPGEYLFELIKGNESYFSDDRSITIVAEQLWYYRLDVIFIIIAGIFLSVFVGYAISSALNIRFTQFIRRKVDEQANTIVRQKDSIIEKERALRQVQEQAFDIFVELSKDLRVSEVRTLASASLQKYLVFKQGDIFSDALGILPVKDIEALFENLNASQSSSSREFSFKANHVKNFVNIRALWKQNTYWVYLTDTTLLERERRHSIEAEKYEVFKKILSRFSHEMNTPLGNAKVSCDLIKGHCQELRDSLESGQISKSNLNDGLVLIDDCNEITIASGLKLQAIMEGIREYQRIENSKDSDHCSISSIAEDAMKQANLYLEENKDSYVLTLDIESKELIVRFPLSISTMIYCLLTNSVLHGRNASESKIHVNLAISVHSQHLRILVSDDGIGIEPDFIDSIFSPLVSKDMSDNGLGIGLFTVKSIAEMKLGGSVSCESTPYNKTVFCVELPLNHLLVVPQIN